MPYPYWIRKIANLSNVICVSVTDSVGVRVSPFIFMDSVRIWASSDLVSHVIQLIAKNWIKPYCSHCLTDHNDINPETSSTLWWYSMHFTPRMLFKARHSHGHRPISVLACHAWHHEASGWNNDKGSTRSLYRERKLCSASCSLDEY